MSGATPDRRRLLLFRLGQVAAYFAALAAVLFLAAGRLNWLAAWIYLIAHLLLAAAAQVWLIRIDPDLVVERSRWGANTKAWDRWIVSANLLLTPVLLVVIGLDAGRFELSVVPWPVRLAALLGFLPGFGLPILASRANTYLASTVRIQAERGQTAVSAGPYAVIRHPMYAGMILFDVCLPLLLGSWWGLAVSGVMVTLVVLRTALEDRTLQAELPGYADYARDVRFRLIPGIW
jgi:protein-S-isoprenylcysteine O-methyltransferase Ste14